MTTDRELLEWAAKAAGIDGKWVDGQSLGWFVASNGRPWEPHLDDGDALRLAVKLEMQVEYLEFTGNARARPRVLIRDGDGWFVEYCLSDRWQGKDPAAATRLAIVRAAASVGQQKGE